MSTPLWKDDADERLLSLIPELVQRNVMVEHFALVVGFVDEDGERLIATNTAPDDRNADTLGLLAWADTAVRQGVAEAIRRDDDPPGKDR